jgi:hypothetical protein
MDEQAASTRVLGSAIVEWLADEALQDSDPAILRTMPAPACFYG